MRDMGAIQRMAQEMQKKMEKAQAELAEAEVQGTAGGGAVSVTLTGALDVKSVIIAKDAVDPEDVETLQDLVFAAMKDGLEKAKKMQAERMNAVTGGLRLPGM